MKLKLTPAQMISLINQIDHEEGTEPTFYLELNDEQKQEVRKNCPNCIPEEL